MSFGYYNISFKKWEIWIIYLKLKDFSCKKKKKGKHNVPKYNLEKYGLP